MKIFKFSNKHQAKTFTFFTVLSVATSIYIFSSLDELMISPSVAYLLVSILSFVSIMFSIRRAGKMFDEIIVDGEKVEFYFANKMKYKLQTEVSKVRLIESNDVIKIEDKLTGKLIGIAHKSSIETEKIDELLTCFS